MQALGISDLLTSLRNRRQNSFLNSELNRLTLEISSGKRSDAINNSSTNVSKISSLQNSISLLGSYQETADTLALEQKIKSDAVETIASSVEGLGASLLSSTFGGFAVLDPLLKDAETLFDSSIGLLNTRVGEKYVFSGENSTTPPLASSDDIIIELQTTTLGITDPTLFWNSVDEWFTQTGNGFDSFAYQGGQGQQTKISVASTVSVDDGALADSSAFRETLRDLSVILLVDTGYFGGSDVDKLQLIEKASTSLISSQKKLVEVGADIGRLQSLIEAANAANAAEDFSIKKALNEITNVDVFEAASELESIQTQLESLYLVTAKTSRLSLSQYLR
ncbi:MAG: flagellin [Pseudomonadota bacterium]